MRARPPSLLSAFMPLLVSLAALAGFIAGTLRARVGSNDAEKVGIALDFIERRYYGEVAPEKLVDAAIESMVRELEDPYSQYLTAEDFRDFNQTQLKGEFGGVGIVVALDRESGFLNVETPVEGSPAFEADILPGDVIRKVDGNTVKGKSLREIVREIKGPPGTPVRLTVFREKKGEFEVTLTRAIITIEAVRSRMLDDDGTAYVRITDFTEMMPQFDAHVGELLEKGMKAMVLDLRFNGGGLLNQCVALADRFLPDGVIVSTRGRTADDNRKFEAEAGNDLPGIPLVVLVNEATASASEIFAAAIQDHGRGVLVGTRTFGKGSVQTPLGLPDGSSIKLTTARYFTPKGRNIHRDGERKDFGIEPDYIIQMSDEEYVDLGRAWSAERVVKGERPPPPEGFVDHQLQAGLEVLRALREKREPDVKPRILEETPEPAADGGEEPR